MKRRDRVRHIESHDCHLLRDRGKHSVYVNPANSQVEGGPPDLVPRKRGESEASPDRVGGGRVDASALGANWL